MSNTTIEHLRQLIQRRQTPAPRPGTGLSEERGDSSQWLSGQGFANGDVSEWIASEAGGGALQVMLASVRQNLPPQSRWLVVDSGGDWFPLAWEEAGLNLSRTVFVRGVAPADALWAVEQGLRSRGVDVVCCQFGRLTPVMGRRLKIAAQAGGALCLMLRGTEALHEPSYADLRVQVWPEPSTDWMRRRLRLQVLKIRNGFPGRVAQVELDDETGTVRVVSELADSAPLRRATRA